MQDGSGKLTTLPNGRGRRGVIYFLQAGEGGAIKIGYCRDLAARMSSIQTHCPEKLIVLGVTGGSKETETAMHDRFAEFKRRGEWFDPVPEILEFTKLLPKELPTEPAERRRVLAMPDDPISIIAAEMGIPDGTVRKWRSRGKVPHHMRFKMMEYARDNHNYIIRTPIFDSFGKQTADAEQAA
jgi:hypothetical protein